MENFIERVRRYPFLWDTNHVSYRDIGRKESAWEAIAKKCGLANGQEAKIQWKKLRDSHREAMRRRKTGQIAHHIRPWKYEELMSFLSPQFSNSTVSNFCDSAESLPLSSESPRSAAGTPEPSFPAGNSSPVRSPPPSSESPRSASTSSKRQGVGRLGQYRAVNTSMTDLAKEREIQREQRQIERDMMRQSLLDMNRAPQDALSNLFTSFCQKTRQLPKVLQLRVEREIFEIVSRAEEEALSLNSANHFLSPTSSSYEYIDDTSYQDSPLHDNTEDNKLSISSVDVSVEFPPQATNTTTHEPQEDNNT